MSRLTDLGTPPTTDADDARLWVDMLHLAGVLAVAFTIAAILGVNDKVWATLGLGIAVAIVWGLARRALATGRRET